MSLLGRTRPSVPDQVVADVAAKGYVTLGTYPEAVLAVTGCYPQRDRYEKRVYTGTGGSPFARLDPAARRASMQAALDELRASGTLDVPAGTPLEKVVSDGLRRRLRLSGPLGVLAGVSQPMHKNGYRVFCIWSDLVAAAVLGAAYSFEKGPFPMALVETADPTTGDYSYALATIAATAAGMAPVLFTDTPGADPGKATLVVIFGFRMRNRRAQHRLILTRETGEATAVGGIAPELPTKSDPAPVSVEAPTFPLFFESFWNNGAAGAR